MKTNVGVSLNDFLKQIDKLRRFEHVPSTASMILDTPSTLQIVSITVSIYLKLF